MCCMMHDEPAHTMMAGVSEALHRIVGVIAVVVDAHTVDEWALFSLFFSRGGGPGGD